MRDNRPPESTTNDASGEQLADAAEAERRRLAQLLQESIVEPLNLLLAQANAYQQTLGAHPPTRLALLVLSSLAYQVLQRARDIEDALRWGWSRHWTCSRASSGASTVSRSAWRPSGCAVELALFRAAQDALDRAVRHAHAQHASVRLERRDEQLILTLADDGDATAGTETLRAASRRIA